MATFEDHATDLENSVPESIWLLQDGRKHVAYLLGRLAMKFKDLKSVLNVSIRGFKVARRQEDEARIGAHAVVH